VKFLLNLNVKTTRTNVKPPIDDFLAKVLYDTSRERTIVRICV